jgi:NAD+ kinase
VALYGVNRGTVGFLMNEYDSGDLVDRIRRAQLTVIRLLALAVTDTHGVGSTHLAVNEVALTRSSPQSAKLRIRVDGSTVLEELVGDGVLVATAAGSTAHNRSAGGPIIPLAAELVGVTPIAPFHPRGWSGALLDTATTVELDVIDVHRRPVDATADSRHLPGIVHAEVTTRTDLALRLLFDPGHGLEARILREQFRL